MTLLQKLPLARSFSGQRGNKLQPVEMFVTPVWVVNSIRRIVRYNWPDEEDFFSGSSDNVDPKNQIARDLEVVTDWLLASPERVTPAPLFWAGALVTFGLLVFFLPELLFAFGVLDNFPGCKR